MNCRITEADVDLGEDELDDAHCQQLRISPNTTEYSILNAIGLKVSYHDGQPEGNCMKDKNSWGNNAQKPLIPSLVHLINRHSGDSRFLMSLQTTCRFLVSSGQVPGYRKELIDDTKNSFAYPEDEEDFQQLMEDCEDGTLTTQMLSDAIAIIDSILASNTGTETLNNATDS